MREETRNKHVGACKCITTRPTHSNSQHHHRLALVATKQHWRGKKSGGRIEKGHKNTDWPRRVIVTSKTIGTKTRRSISYFTHEHVNVHIPTRKSYTPGQCSQTASYKEIKKKRHTHRREGGRIHFFNPRSP